MDPGTKLILIVEDDLETKRLLEHLVRLQGFQTQLANNGADALEKVRERVPDLIIMDLMMPDVGGFEAIRGLHSACEARVPVIINTARRIDPSIVEELRAEANVLELFAKPTDYRRLFELIHSRLGTEPPPQKPLPKRDG